MAAVCWLGATWLAGEPVSMKNSWLARSFGRDSSWHRIWMDDGKCKSREGWKMGEKREVRWNEVEFSSDA